MSLELNKLYNGDCLDVMKEIEDKSIDMILCDLPYQTTNCSWDTIIPFNLLWNEYDRIRKLNTPIVLTCMQPFTSKLIMSNIDNFKYCWIWDKVNKFTGCLNAKRMPMLDYEEIAIFYEKQCIYNPQLREGSYVTRKTNGNRNTPTTNYVNIQKDSGRKVDGLLPKRILSIPSHTTKKLIHPTQKPVELMEYLIKTYTNEGMLVLDNCAGSGTTLIAAKNTKRNFIGIEKNEEYFKLASERLEKV